MNETPNPQLTIATLSAVLAIAITPCVLASPANNAAAVDKCVQISKTYAGYETTLREAANLPTGVVAAKTALSKLMTAAKAFPHDVRTPAQEAVCAGLLSIGDLANYAKVRAQLSDPKGLELAVSKPCPNCGGQPLDPETCSKCGGTGSCPNPKCQGGSMVTQGMAGTAPLHITCMTCQGTTKCPICKGTGSVPATCRTCKGKGQILDQDDARDVFRQYMDVAIAAARAKQAVLVKTTGSGTTTRQAIKQAIAAAATQIHGKEKALQALAQDTGSVVKAFAPVGTPTENEDGTFSVTLKVCVAKTLPEAAPVVGDDDPAFKALEGGL